MKFKVTAPVTDYVGSIDAVQFTGGVAIIDEEIHPAVLAYCRSAGYSIEDYTPETSGPDSERDGLFDPSAYGMPDVLSYLSGADHDEALRVLDVEAEGKNRKGITDQRDAILASKKESTP